MRSSCAGVAGAQLVEQTEVDWSSLRERRPVSAPRLGLHGTERGTGHATATPRRVEAAAVSA